jgi:hypothetical protein
MSGGLIRGDDGDGGGGGGPVILHFETNWAFDF